MNRTEAAAILGVPVTATEAEARKAYLARARLLHPDRFAEAPPSDVAAATTAMSQLNEAMETFRSGAASSGSSSQTPPPPPPPPSSSDSNSEQDAGPTGWHDASSACVMCGWGPAAPVKFNSVTGLVIFWRWGTLSGNLCRRCGEAAYNEAQRSTLLKGWWGIIAPLATVVAFLGNMTRIGAVRRLSEPVGRFAGARTPLLQPMHYTVPWYRRGSSLAATAVAFALIAFLVFASLPPSASTTDSEDTVGDSKAAVGSCWSYDEADSSYAEVPCSSPQADFEISKSVNVESECPNDYWVENDGTFSCFGDVNPSTAKTPPTPKPTPSATGVPNFEKSACISGKNVEDSCSSGTTWTYSYCWDLSDPAVALQRYSDGGWTTVETLTASKDEYACDADYPYAVEFSVAEPRLGSTKYRIKPLDGATPDSFTATVTAPAKYFRTCVKDSTGYEECQDGLSWVYESCWSGGGTPVVQTKATGSWTTLRKGTGKRDTNFCDNEFPYRMTVKNTQKYPGTYNYRLYIPSSGTVGSASEALKVTVEEK